MNRNELFRSKDFITFGLFNLCSINSNFQSNTCKTCLRSKAFTKNEGFKKHVRYVRRFVWVHQEYGLIFVKKSKICMGVFKVRKFAVKTKKGLLKYGFLAIRKAKIHNFSPSVFWYSIYKTNYTIVRPLMNFLRSNITIICKKSKLPVSPDFSNFKINYSRNRIRKQIVPILKTFFNPKMEKALGRFSESKTCP